MRILHFYSTYYPDTYGGVEKFISQMIDGGKYYKIEITLLVLSNNVKGISHDLVNNIYYVESDLNIQGAKFSFKCIKLFKELVTKNDIIHYHFPWPFMDLVHLYLGIKKPSVVTYHSDIIRQKYLYIIYKFIMDKFLNDVSKIVVSSSNYFQSSKVLLKHYHKVEVIPFGLSQNKFKNHQKIISNDSIKYCHTNKFFLFLGVHRHYKGLFYLIEALKFKEYNIIIAGEGPVSQDIKNLVLSYNLKQIVFVGNVNEYEKEVLYKYCYAFVFPSHLRSESFGFSLLEAAMHGKSMISCEIGTGTSFININKETGLVVPPKNPKAISDALHYLWNNPEENKWMGENAKKRYTKFFTIDKMISSYYQIYNKLISAN